MFFRTNKKRKYTAGVMLAMLLFFSVQSAWAAGPPAPSIFSNSLAVVMIFLMIVLLIVIGVLANILIAAADIKLRKSKIKKEQKSKTKLSAAVVTGLLLISNVALAQADPATTEASKSVVQTIGGLSSAVFYVMAGAIFFELLIILALLVDIKILLKAEKEKVAATELKMVVERKPGQLVNWWNRFNKFKPVAQEADIDLGHDYDGIRELDNRLPPWWLYGFYITIVFAAVYLWRSHVSHSAPSSKEEYEMAVKSADIRVKEYLKQKGDAVDENTVIMLGLEDITEGQKLFLASCAACHKENGGGIVGPNLTDDYWIHGADIKSIFKTIKYGVDGKGMASWQSNFSPKQMAQITSFVKSLKGSHPPDAKEPQGQLYTEENTPPNPSIDSAANKENKVVMNANQKT